MPAGVYNIGTIEKSAYCQADGSTVIQRRGQYGNGANYFAKTWSQYESGFGEPGKAKFF